MGGQPFCVVRGNGRVTVVIDETVEIKHVPCLACGEVGDTKDHIVTTMEQSPPRVGFVGTGPVTICGPSAREAEGGVYTTVAHSGVVRGQLPSFHSDADIRWVVSRTAVAHSPS
eukprot:gene18521-10639_t